MADEKPEAGKATLVELFEQLRLAVYARTCDFRVGEVLKPEQNGLERLELFKLPDTEENRNCWRVTRVVYFNKMSGPDGSLGARLESVKIVHDQCTLEKALTTLGQFEFDKRKSGAEEIGQSAYELGTRHFVYFGRIQGFKLDQHGTAHKTVSGRPISEGTFAGGSTNETPFVSEDALSDLRGNVLADALHAAEKIITPASLTLEDSLKYLEVRTTIHAINRCLYMAKAIFDHATAKTEETGKALDLVTNEIQNLRSTLFFVLAEEAGIDQKIKKLEALDYSDRQSDKHAGTRLKIHKFKTEHGLDVRNYSRLSEPEEWQKAIVFISKALPALGRIIGKKCGVNPLLAVPCESMILGMALIISYHRLCNKYEAAEIESKSPGKYSTGGMLEVKNYALFVKQQASSMGLTDGQIEALLAMAATKRKFPIPQAFVKLMTSFEAFTDLVKTLDPIEIAKKLEDIGKEQSGKNLDLNDQFILDFGSEFIVDPKKQGSGFPALLMNTFKKFKPFGG